MCIGNRYAVRAGGNTADGRTRSAAGVRAVAPHISVRTRAADGIEGNAAVAAVTSSIVACGTQRNRANRFAHHVSAECFTVIRIRDGDRVNACFQVHNGCTVAGVAVGTRPRVVCRVGIIGCREGDAAFVSAVGRCVRDDGRKGYGIGFVNRDRCDCGAAAVGRCDRNHVHARVEHGCRCGGFAVAPNVSVNAVFAGRGYGRRAVAVAFAECVGHCGNHCRQRVGFGDCGFCGVGTAVGIRDQNGVSARSYTGQIFGGRAVAPCVHVRSGARVNG